MNRRYRVMAANSKQYLDISAYRVHVCWKFTTQYRTTETGTHHEYIAIPWKMCHANPAQSIVEVCEETSFFSFDKSNPIFPLFFNSFEEETRRIGGKRERRRTNRREGGRRKARILWNRDIPRKMFWGWIGNGIQKMKQMLEWFKIWRYCGSIRLTGQKWEGRGSPRFSTNYTNMYKNIKYILTWSILIFHIEYTLYTWRFIMWMYKSMSWMFFFIFFL